MNNDIKNVSKLECKQIELEVEGYNTYLLELDNNSIKLADKLGIMDILQSNQLTTIAENLIYIFAKKHQPEITQSLATKIVNTLIDNEYDIMEMVQVLVEEFSVRYEQVFTSKGKKKALKMI